MSKTNKRRPVKLKVNNNHPMGFMSFDQFTQKEATALLNYEVVAKKDQHTLPSPPLNAIGFIVGVLAINDEIELLVRFDDELTQVIKSEFNREYVVVPD